MGAHAPLRLEVIACSLEDALAAEAGGADRLELVRDLPAGGLTPSLDLVDAVLARVRIPVRVMVRETISHFVSDPRDRSRLLATAQALAERSVDGIVIGAVTQGVMSEARGADASTVPDIPLLASVLPASGGKRATFHRAFESVSDPVVALGEIGRLGSAVDRVLTNGGAGDWPTRFARLRAWARACPPHLEFILGGGVTREVLDVLPLIPALREVHIGRAAREPATDDGLVRAHKVEAIATRLHAMSR